MSDAPEQDAAEGDLAHGFGAVATLLGVAHQVPPSGHPAEGAFDRPAAWKDIKALDRTASLDDLEGEVDGGGLFYDFVTVIDTVGE